MTKYRQIVGEVFNRPWAILPDKLEAICGFIEARLSGAHSLTEAEIDRMAMAGKPPAHEPGQSIAVLPLWGTLHHHASMISRYSGGTSTVQFCKAFKEAINSPDIGTIVMHTNGPGGTVSGCEEAAELIYENRGKKRVIAAVDAMAASATYWIASSAGEMYLTPSGSVGSIGVVYMHREISQAEESAGIKTTLIAIPEGKVAGNPYEPISDEFRAKIAEDNEVYYRKFVAGVAQNRDVSTTTVVETFGGGGMVLADKAAALKMVDGVKTFDRVIADIQAEVTDRTSRRSAASRRREIEMAKVIDG